MIPRPPSARPPGYSTPTPTRSCMEAPTHSHATQVTPIASNGPRSPSPHPASRARLHAQKNARGTNPPTHATAGPSAPWTWAGTPAPPAQPSSSSSKRTPPPASPLHPSTARASVLASPAPLGLWDAPPKRTPHLHGAWRAAPHAHRVSYSARGRRWPPGHWQARARYDVIRGRSK